MPIVHQVHKDTPGATDATGATGQQGLNGDTDAAGLPRITQLNAINTYQIGESFLKQLYYF